MPWLNVAGIPAKNSWQFTAQIPLNIEWIRIRHSLSDPSFFGYLAQCDKMRDFYELIKIYPYEPRIYKLDCPPSFTSRRIAFKMSSTKRTLLTWVVYVDIWV
jgi:hypothetical protein